MFRTNYFFLKYCWLGFLWLAPWFVIAQNTTDVSFEKVQGEGLTNHFIKCIQQDKKGFLWFGTSEGIFRYDGYAFKAFKNFPDDPHSLVNNTVEFILPDKELIWIGSWGGLSCFDTNTDSIKNFFSDEPLKVYSIVPANDSVLWIGTASGLFLFNKKNASWKRISALEKNVFIRSLCYDGNHHLCITAHNGFYYYNTATGDCKHYLLPVAGMDKKSPQVVHKSILDKKGNLWMTTWSAGLIRFDPHTEKITEWVKKNVHDHQPFQTAFDILQADDENLWIANQNGGLTIFNPETGSSVIYPVEWDNEKKLSDGVYALFRDRSGIFWIGTENGIYKYDRHTVHLSTTDFLLKTDTGLVRTQLLPICLFKDTDELWWLGTYDGLFLFDKASGILQNYNAAAGIPAATAVTNILQEKNGGLWVAAGNMLFSVSKKIKGRSFSLQSKIFKLPGTRSSIYKLYIDREERIWVGTHASGVFMFDAGSKKFIAYPSDGVKTSSQVKQVRCFYEISRDSLLAGGENTGVLLLHINSGKYEKIKWKASISKTGDDITINDIVQKDNDLWIATEYNGLWQTDEHLQKLTRYTIHDGLPSMNISSVLVDRRAHLWLLTEGGIVDFQPLNNHITVYDKKDDLRNLFYLNGILQDEKGNIVIGDMGCVHSFNPFRTLRNNHPPEIFITGFKVFDKEYPFSNNQPVRLSYHQNYFSFEYTALNYTLPELNSYEYKLDGLDEQWNDAGTRRYVSYAGLKEGTYTFKVKACNNEGVWNNLPATVTLVIEPPFWHRGWFYLLVTLLIASVAYLIYSMKVNQWKIRYQLRNKIARDLHDDIGSTLSGINIFSKIALQKMNKKESQSKELLKKISERSAKTMDALSDIVWSIDTKNDNMENVLAKMQEYLSETLETQDIQYSFEIDEAIHRTKLDMGIRKELYLIFKETIHNACKYARCNCVHISFRRKKDVCTLIIQDNGKGFDVNNGTQGNGLQNMRQRAEKMKSALSIESEITKGTTITLQFPVT